MATVFVQRVWQVELWQETSQMHICPPNQQIFQHWLGKLAVQPVGMTTATFLVVKPQDNHSAHDDW